MKTIVIGILFGLACLAFGTELVEVQSAKEDKDIKKVELVVAKQRALNEELTFVEIPDDEQSGIPGKKAVLPCRFSICSQTSQSVVVTWKIGKDPNTAILIAECTDYDTAAKECLNFIVHNEAYEGRVSMITPGSPDLTVRLPRNEDNHNFWCKVQAKDDNEYGTDIASVVLRVKNSENEKPKFNHVSLQKRLHEAKSGDTVNLDCSCEGFHCDDVAWYSGPSNEWANGFEDIYRKKTVYRADPIVSISDNWKNRISVDGYTLTIHNVQAADAGRYWCEARSADYLNIGEAGVDAKSTVLTVDRVGEYICA